nr:hypothetical protein [Tanacetum cinerariifolium]
MSSKDLQQPLAFVVYHTCHIINIRGDLDEHQTSTTLELNEEESYDKSLSEDNIIDTSQPEATTGNKGTLISELKLSETDGLRPSQPDCCLSDPSFKARVVGLITGFDNLNSSLPGAELECKDG